MTEFRVSTNVGEFDIPLIHRFLAEDSYWLKGVALATVRKSIANSLCFGGFIEAQQIAFGRAVTDLATFAYLRDIFVLPAYRGSGRGRLLVQAMMSRLKDDHPWSSHARMPSFGEDTMKLSRIRFRHRSRAVFPAFHRSGFAAG